MRKDPPMKTMHTKNRIAAALACALAFTIAATTLPAQESHYDKLANAPFPGGYPARESVQPLKNELLFQQASQSFIWSLPAVSMWAMKEGSEKVFGAGYNVLPYWPERLTAKTLVPTPNSDMIYAMSYLNLKDGPLVVEAPPDLEGLFDDFFQRPLIGPTIDGHTWIGDVGFAGPDKGKGGTYVLLPPDYTGAVPKNAFVYRSRTYNVFLFWRTFFTDPNNLSKPDDTIRKTRVYPLGKKDQAKPMVFPDANAQPAEMLFPQDGRFFDMLSRFIDAEYADPVDFYMRGMLHTIGIEKGKPFCPDPAMRTLLDQAAKTAFKMTRVIATDLIQNEPVGRYFPDRQWVDVMAGGSPFFTGAGDTFLNIQQQSFYFAEAYGMSPGMAVSIPDKGSKYPGTFRDKDGDLLDGGKSYKLHIPPNVPATRFWSATLYDALTASGIDNGQPFPSINLMDKPPQNDDGSVDLYFGPTAPAGKEKSWIRTLPRKGFFVLFRFYSPEEAFLNGSWELDDVVKVK
jgi:hypothetical protein